MPDMNTTRSNTAHDPALIVRALTSLEYAPLDAVDDAARRMARAPQLVTNLFAYVMAGKPSIDAALRAPAELFVGLPGGFSVASLVRDFGLSTVGAFLMASELVADTASAQTMLDTIIEEGYVRTMSDGVRALLYPPISDQYPVCPVSYTHLTLPTILRV